MLNPLHRKRARPRIDQHNTKKHDWFTISLSLFFWAITIFIIFFVDPVLLKDILISDSYLPFFITLFMAIFFSIGFILKNNTRSLIYTSSLVFLLFLSLKDLGHILNLILVGLLILAYEAFFGTLSDKLPFSGRS